MNFLLCRYRERYNGIIKLVLTLVLFCKVTEDLLIVKLIGKIKCFNKLVIVLCTLFHCLV